MFRTKYITSYLHIYIILLPIIYLCIKILLFVVILVVVGAMCVLLCSHCFALVCCVVCSGLFMFVCMLCFTYHHQPQLNMYCLTVCLTWVLEHFS